MARVMVKSGRTTLCVYPRTGMCCEKVKNAIAYVVWGLRFEMHVPVVSTRDPLFQVPGA